MCHDAWLGMLDIDHHHDHHVAVDQHHGDHSHPGDPEHDHRDSVPLPDTHTEPATPGIAKVGVDGPKQVSEADHWFLVAVSVFLSGTAGTEFEHPPPQWNSDFDPPALLLLAHSVQSNAPPVLS